MSNHFHPLCKDCTNTPIGPYEGTNKECQFCRKKRLDKVVDRTNSLENKWRDYAI